MRLGSSAAPDALETKNPPVLHIHQIYQLYLLGGFDMLVGFDTWWDSKFAALPTQASLSYKGLACPLQRTHSSSKESTCALAFRKVSKEAMEKGTLSVANP